MIELHVDRVTLLATSDTPVVVLVDQHSDTYLPIWVTAGSAQAIMSALEADEEGGAHELAVRLCRTFSQITDVAILGFTDGVFSAALNLGAQQIECRATDAIAIALRAHVPIRCPKEVLESVGVSVSGLPNQIPDEEVEQFLEYLDRITPEDFQN